MNRRAPAAAALLAVLAAGCGLFGKPDNYYPMGAGSTWSYSIWATSETPAEALDTVMTGTMEVAATGMILLHSGQEAVEFVSTTTSYLRVPLPDTSVAVDTQYLRDTGDHILRFDALDDTAPDTVLALPLAANRSWHANDSTVVTAEEQEDVTVAAGAYKSAWRLAANTGGAFELEQWYGNHAGLVQWQLSGAPLPGYRFVTHAELVASGVKE